MPRFPHYCRPRVWTPRPLRAQQQPGCGTVNPESCRGWGCSEAWAAPRPRFQGLLTDKSRLTWLLPAVGGRQTYRAEGAWSRATQRPSRPRGGGLRRKSTGRWIWGTWIRILPARYQLGAPGCYFPPLCLGLHTSEVEQHHARARVGVRAERCRPKDRLCGRSSYCRRAGGRGRASPRPSGAPHPAWQAGWGAVAGLLTGPPLGRGRP